MSHGQTTSTYMLLFYAAECGLKVRYMQRENIATTARFENALLGQAGHDIHQWVKKARIPARVGTCPRNLTLIRAPQQSRPISEAHQAWRYGVHIDKQIEGDLVAYLRSLVSYLEVEGIS